jgi:hypothetical protein
VIEGNTIRNVWDCGIERLGNSTDSITIRNNDITSAAECGLGGWFSAGWRDSIIADNTVSNSGAFARIYFSATQNKGIDHITFRNNVFENNRFQYPSSMGLPSVSIDYATATAKFPVDIGNNTFRNNDFGSDIPVPRLAPTAGFLDGGENICRQDVKSLTCVSSCFDRAPVQRDELTLNTRRREASPNANRNRTRDLDVLRTPRGRPDHPPSANKQRLLANPCGTSGQRRVRETHSDVSVHVGTPRSRRPAARKLTSPSRLHPA